MLLVHTCFLSIKSGVKVLKGNDVIGPTDFNNDKRVMHDYYVNCMHGAGTVLQVVFEYY